jgi:steroid 5-alpha reductase family enzyme
MSPWLLIVTALAGLCGLFALLYLLARRVDNYGIVDIAWSYAFALLAGYYALFAPGWWPRRALVAGLAVVWSLRLGTHLCRRVIGHHPVEDGRYVQLRRDWAGNFAPKMAGFFQLQAASVVLLGIPFLLPALNSSPQFHPLEIAGAVLWLIAILGESLADAQLAGFKRDPANRGRVCATGLWRCSRHPNYFFEWLIWVAYFGFALASPWGWLAALSPAIILYLLLRVTGIPLTEQQSLRSKGDAYRQYQAATSAFVPWWPKKFNH